MTSRAQFAAHVLGLSPADAGNGYMNGCGYPGPLNRMETYLGRGAEYWCGDAVTYWFAAAGLRLPSMQVGCSTGFAYCPSALAFGRSHGIVVPSWQAQPGDIFLFDWNGDGTADHTELCTSNSGGVAYTIGGDSGPSNVDGYQGQGGNHRHKWSVPTSVGNRYVIGVINAGHLVNFTTTLYYPTLVVKSPYMTGYDIVAVQNKLIALGFLPAKTSTGQPNADGVYGPTTAGAVKKFQEHHWPTQSSMWTSQVTTIVRQALGLPTGP